MHGPYPHVLAKLVFFLIALSLISAVCSECIPPFSHMRTSLIWSMQACLFLERMHSGITTELCLQLCCASLPWVSPCHCVLYVCDLIHELGYYHCIHHRSICQQCRCSMYICISTLLIASHSHHVHSLHQRNSGYHRLLPDLGNTAPRIVYTLVCAWTGCASLASVI